MTEEEAMDEEDELDDFDEAIDMLFEAQKVSSKGKTSIAIE